MQASATLLYRKQFESSSIKFRFRQRLQSPALMSHASVATFFAASTCNATFRLTFGGYIFGIYPAFRRMRNLSSGSHGSTCDSSTVTVEDTGTSSSPSSLSFTLLRLALLGEFRRYGTLAKGQV